MGDSAVLFFTLTKNELSKSAVVFRTNPRIATELETILKFIGARVGCQHETVSLWHEKPEEL